MVQEDNEQLPDVKGLSIVMNTCELMMMMMIDDDDLGGGY